MITPPTCPFSKFFWLTGFAFLFTGCILDLDILSGSLSVSFCSPQLVIVDSKVKRNLIEENSELPRPSTHLRIPMFEIETEAFHVTITYFRAPWTVWSAFWISCGLVITPPLLVFLWIGDHAVPVGFFCGLVITPSLCRMDLGWNW